MPGAGYRLLETNSGPAADRAGRPRRADWKRRLLPAHLPISRSRLIVLSIAFALISLFGLSATYVSGSWPRDVSLETEVELEVAYWQVRDHNAAVSARLDKCASLGLLRNTSSPPLTHNPLHIEAEYEAAGCGLNSTTLILISSVYFAEAYIGATGGEAIWAQSVMDALDRWGYSYMFTTQGWWNHDMRKTVQVYQKYPEQVRFVLADPEQIIVCFNEQRWNCINSKETPGGLEEWRFLGFNFWDTNDTNFGPAWWIPEHPLGPNFTLSPAAPSLTTHYSLPYSIENTCRDHALSSKITPPRTYIMTKKSSFLSPDMPSFPWKIPALSGLAKELEVDLVVGLSEDDDPATGSLLQENGVTDLGKLGKAEFAQAVSESSVLLGAGKPFISPSPWVGLCLGVPFINPIIAWDEDQPNNKTSWKLQHGHMADLKPPYVYTVRARDFKALRDAMLSALENPIASYIPPHMTIDAVSHRVAEMVERDWESIYKS